MKGVWGKVICHSKMITSVLAVHSPTPGGCLVLSQGTLSPAGDLCEPEKFCCFDNSRCDALQGLEVVVHYLSIYLYIASQVVLVVKKLPANARDIRNLGLIPGSGRSPGGGHGNPLQYSCLENTMEEEPGGLQSMGSQRDKHD